MIQNIIIPIPMPTPMPVSSSSFDGASFVAFFVAVFVLGLVSYLGGYLYAGIKNGDWSFFDISEYNLAKLLGSMLIGGTLVIVFVFLVAQLVKSILV